MTTIDEMWDWLNDLQRDYENDELQEIRIPEMRFKKCRLCGGWEDLEGKRADWTRHQYCFDRAKYLRRKAQRHDH